MRFYSFGEESFDKLARSKVGDVSAGLLYYLFSGRNAWHSTWITRYTEGCMHGDLQGAKDTAERQRKQGSVFYIAELQALIIKSAAGVLAVTEINSGRPLSGYAPDAVQDDVPAGTRKLKGARDCYIQKPAPMLGAALSFDHMSRFWNQRPPPRNAVVVVAANDPALAFDLLPAAKLQSRCSYSNGGSYRLGWRTIDDGYGGIAAEPVRRIAARFEREPAQVPAAALSE